MPLVKKPKKGLNFFLTLKLQVNINFKTTLFGENVEITKVDKFEFNVINLRFIQELLGHTSSRTTEIYTHVSEKNLQKIVSPFDRL